MKTPYQSVQSQSCPTLCDLMDCSTPGFPVHHQLPEFTQTQVHRVGDAIQPSHPLSSPTQQWMPPHPLTRPRYFGRSFAARWKLLGPLDCSQRKSILNIHWKDWCWSWISNTLATWCQELTHLKRPWRWERLKVGEGDDRGWDGWMASPTRWTWVWVNSRSWWWTGRPGVLQSMGSQRVGHHWATELMKCKKAKCNRLR